MVNRIALDTAVTKAVAPSRSSSPDPSEQFSSVLAREVGKAESIQFSAHARQRMDARGITLGPKEQARVSRALDEAAAKGSRESLLLMGRLALVVSVPNRTVITAVPQNEVRDAVFTNIDSAVVVSE